MYKNHPKDVTEHQKETCFSEGERSSSHIPRQIQKLYHTQNSKCSIQPAAANATFGNIPMLLNQSLGYSSFLDHPQIRAKDSSTIYSDWTCQALCSMLRCNYVVTRLEQGYIAFGWLMVRADESGTGTKAHTYVKSNKCLHEVIYDYLL